MWKNEKEADASIDSDDIGRHILMFILSLQSKKGRSPFSLSPALALSSAALLLERVYYFPVDDDIATTGSP